MCPQRTDGVSLRQFHRCGHNLIGTEKLSALFAGPDKGCRAVVERNQSSQFHIAGTAADYVQLRIVERVLHIRHIPFVIQEYARIDKSFVLEIHIFENDRLIRAVGHFHARDHALIVDDRCAVQLAVQVRISRQIVGQVLQSDHLLILRSNRIFFLNSDFTEHRFALMFTDINVYAGCRISEIQRRSVDDRVSLCLEGRVALCMTVYESACLPLIVDAVFGHFLRIDFK